MENKGKLLAQLAEDPFTLVDTLYAICKPQCDEREITEEEFGAGVVGNAIDTATAMLLEGVMNLFHGEKRRAIKKAIEKLNTLQQKRGEAMLKMLDDPRLAAKLDADFEAESAQRLEEVLKQLDELTAGR